MRSDAHFGFRVVWAVAWIVVIRPGPVAFAADGDRDDDGVCDLCEDLGGNGTPVDDDSDGDGTPNYLDDDDDDDKILTIDEDADGDGDPSNDRTDPLGPSEGPDYLNDYIPVDRDHDGFRGPDFHGADCDDLRFGINPGVDHDPLYDGQDWDCDGGAFEYDGDHDGYESQGEIADGDDCNDYDPTVHPGAIEGSEGAAADAEVDLDCDGWTDAVGSLVPRNGCDCDAVGPGTAAMGLSAGLALVVRRRR